MNERITKEKLQRGNSKGLKKLFVIFNGVTHATNILLQS